ncbi:MAG TPA: prolyl oligopeptidase family serine peptidase [Ktedonobacterales bacterium]|jgi:pimeloyl-ACP methyl ester carboxylesterase|nr:prolyl oligopeptidase family serine peptidase [Ktedonobacterales bacterium]
MRTRILTIVALLALAGSAFVGVHVARATAGTTLLTGSIGGAAYKIEVPAQWNGTLVLYSHGYVFPGSKNPAQDAGDPATAAFLLSQGYALAGSSYSATGWALQQAFHDQTALLDFFNANVGHPARVIAWGHSLGGIITAGLVQQFPDRFVGALPMCGVLAGGVATWNPGLDGAFAFKLLLAGNDPTLPIVHLGSIPQSVGELNRAETILGAAQATPQGKARIALIAALGDVPDWFSPATPEPAADDLATQEQNQFLWEAQTDFPFLFAGRAELEARAGGNPSWNTGVNYQKQLDQSVDRDEVRALYQQAGLDLDADLSTLNAAPRIAADPGAVSYLENFIVFNGDLQIPVLTMHTTGDGLVVNQQENAYRDVVHTAGNAKMLRQVFVHRAGHCAFTPGETIAAFQTLIHRIDTGKWQDTTATDTLNAAASALGPALNTVPGFTAGPAFVDFDPAKFLRPFDARDITRPGNND